MPRVRAVFDDIDERLCTYIDDTDHLSVPGATKALGYTERLLAGELTIAELHEHWEDWYPGGGVHRRLRDRRTR